MTNILHYDGVLCSLSVYTVGIKYCVLGAATSTTMRLLPVLLGARLSAAPRLQRIDKPWLGNRADHRDGITADGLGIGCLNLSQRRCQMETATSFSGGGQSPLGRPEGRQKQVTHGHWPWLRTFKHLQARPMDLE